MKIETDHRFLPIIFQSIPHGIFTIDDQTRITSFNYAAEKITGFKHEEAIGKRCYEIFRADICQEECPLKRSVRTMEQEQDREVTILTKKGRNIVISICTAALTDMNGNVIGGVEMFRDLSQVIELRKKLNKSYVFEDIVSKNPEMQKILERIPMFAASNSTVLIEGASGTGKELIARALHNIGTRKDKPFITVNCAALPDSLLESELFGYMKGAFTDAKKDKPGRFQIANKGSILLDEIGEISQAMQAKLLRVLQEREFEPLGSTQTVKVDIRIIASTNRNLYEEVKKGRFREDLFYRLNVLYIKLPELNKRSEDIPILVDYFIDRFSRIQNREIKRISDKALAALMVSPFHGNIRELENAIEYAFVICRQSTIELHHLPPQYSNIVTVSDLPMDKPFKVAEAEVIRSSLKRNNENRTLTAKELGISRNTLWRKMKRFGIMP
ncbi:MAG: sigma 54-interacting transcriptional regulator [Desulfobacterales bacterium]|nr:sigma 54-interacting transcriptional regulator [Desulfobacterales bacterium]